MYKNEVELTEKLALDLYELADEYVENGLMKLCEEFLCKNLTSENLFLMIEFVEKFEAEALRESVLKFVIQDHEEIKKNFGEDQGPDFYLWEAISKMSTICKGLTSGKSAIFWDFFI